MSMTDQVTRHTPVSAAGELDEIEDVIARTRQGALTEDAALETIGRIVQRRTATTETYQKAWG